LGIIHVTWLDTPRQSKHNPGEPRVATWLISGFVAFTKAEQAKSLHLLNLEQSVE